MRPLPVEGRCRVQRRWGETALSDAAGRKASVGTSCGTGGVGTTSQCVGLPQMRPSGSRRMNCVVKYVMSTVTGYCPVPHPPHSSTATSPERPKLAPLSPAAQHMSSGTLDMASESPTGSLDRIYGG